MPNIFLSEEFKKNTLSIYGEAGENFLTSIPELVEEYSTKWGLSEIEPILNQSYNFVAQVEYKGKKAVLKMGLDYTALKNEAAALHILKNHGAVQILHQDLAKGILLLEYAEPGHPITNFFPHKDAEAILIAANLMKTISSAKYEHHTNLPTLQTFLMDFEEEYDLPEKLMENARKLRDKYNQNPYRVCFLHGDLHHDNILSNGDHYSFIDPHGFIGEVGYEIAVYLKNPIKDLGTVNNLTEITQTRIKLFAEHLNLPEKYIMEWGIIGTMLSAVWDCQGNFKPTVSLKVATILAELLENYTNFQIKMDK